MSSGGKSTTNATASPKATNSSNSNTTNSNDNSTPNNSSQKLTRNNSTAKFTTLSAGTYTVGQAIPQGRYVIKSEDGSGNFIVTSNGQNEINSILTGPNQNLFDGSVRTVTCNLLKGAQIQISGINKVSFTPATTKLRTTLGAGIWVVGLDIAPGRYKAVPVNGSGNFIVYSPDGTPVVNQILSSQTNPTEGTVQNYTCDLSTGEIIQISSLNEVKFEKAN